MDSTDEELYGSTSFTTKGRRTKRQRTTTSNTGGGGAENSYGSSTSASPYDNDIISEATTTTSTEEEHMANCLILLAQGTTTIRKNTKTPKSNNNNNNNNYNTGIYECKTCNKTFYSFQALGGHRTSHKKVIKHLSVPASSVPTTSRPAKPNDSPNKVDDTKTRIHECSICGSEFPSGQALGGHMRRHRSSHVPPPSQSGTVLGSDLGGAKNILSLDLNLPAPDDQNDEIIVDHIGTTKFHVLPTPALLDCHY